MQQHTLTRKFKKSATDLIPGDIIDRNGDYVVAVIHQGHPGCSDHFDHVVILTGDNHRIVVRHYIKLPYYGNKFL